MANLMFAPTTRLRFQRWGLLTRQGFLGADFAWDGAVSGYRISGIVQGDIWSAKFCGPLARLGLAGVKAGDIMLAINNKPLSKAVPPAFVLSNLADKEVYQIPYR